MTPKAFRPGCRLPARPNYYRAIVLACLLIWMMLATAGAQHPSSASSQPQLAPISRPESEYLTDDAFAIFADLLAVTAEAAAPNSHWRVHLSSWHDRQAAWEKASTAPSAPDPALARCALPLARARALIEQADALFTRASHSPHPFESLRLIEQHEKFQEQARVLLKQAGEGFRAVRPTDPKAGELTDEAGLLLLAQARPARRPEPEGEQRIRSDAAACRLLRELLDLHRRAAASPGLTNSPAWRDAGDKMAALFSYDQFSGSHLGLMQNCHCPLVKAREHTESLYQRQAMRANPPAPDARSVKNLDRAIQEEQRNIRGQIERTVECIKKVCPENSPLVLRLWVNAFIPRTIQAATRVGRTYTGGPKGATYILGPEPPWQTGYLTDQREFSNEPQSLSRLHAEAYIELAANGTARFLGQMNWCSPSVSFDIGSKQIRCRKTGDQRDISFRQVGQSPYQLVLDLRAAVTNPCVEFFGSNPSPAIRADLTIRIDFGKRSLAIEGKVTQFPAFEAYLSIADGPAQTLFRKNPIKEKSPWDIYLGPTEKVSAAVSF